MFLIEFLCTINSLNVDYVCDMAEFAKSIKIPINLNLFKSFSEAHKYLTVEPPKFFIAFEKLLYLRVNNGYNIGISDSSLAAHIKGDPYDLKAYKMFKSN